MVWPKSELNHCLYVLSKYFLADFFHFKQVLPSEHIIFRGLDTIMFANKFFLPKNVRGHTLITLACFFTNFDQLSNLVSMFTK